MFSYALLILYYVFLSLSQNKMSLKEKLDRLAFRPFGDHNYSYPEEWMMASSWSVWAAVTLGSLQIDWREAAAVLGGSLWAQETIKYDKNINGASWVHNVQAGYCAYHYFVKNNTKTFVWFATRFEIGADLVAVSGITGKFYDYAHAEGFAIGLLTAFILDKIVSNKKPLL